jgi:hypothetical protein
MAEEETRLLPVLSRVSLTILGLHPVKDSHLLLL